MKVKERTGISEEILQKTKNFGSCDIVVGIPSYNHAESIGHVFQIASEGLKRYFPNQNIVLVNSDGGSTDGTPQVAREHTNLNCLLFTHSVTASDTNLNPYHGIPAKRNALRLVLEIGDSLEAKVCGFLAPDLLSLKPEWMELLLNPILQKEMDYVVPSYLRHPYDGTITKCFVYPILRALFGKRIQQPIGGEFAIGRNLYHTFLNQPGWDSEVLDYGGDVWLATHAMAQGAKICQAHLGVRKQSQRKSNVQLSSMLVQIIGSVFHLMEETFPVWEKITGSEPVAEYGEPPQLELSPVSVRVDHMVRAFKLGVKEFFPLWEGILTENTIGELKKLEANGNELRFPDGVWVQMIYEFALAYHRRTMAQEHLLKSLTPLYLGWVASFILKTRQCKPQEVEQKIEALCLIFEEKKTRLMNVWEEASPKTPQDYPPKKASKSP